MCAHIYEKLPQKFLHSRLSSWLANVSVGACIGNVAGHRVEPSCGAIHCFSFPVHKSMGDILVLISRSICFAWNSLHIHTHMCTHKYICTYVYVSLYIGAVFVFALAWLLQRILD